MSASSDAILRRVGKEFINGSESMEEICTRSAFKVAAIHVEVGCTGVETTHQVIYIDCLHIKCS